MAVTVSADRIVAAGGHADADDVQQASFKAMGCKAHVVIHGGTPAMLVFAEQRIRELESLWSRFLETSDITVANRMPGMPVRVHEDTLAVVARAIVGWKQTAGSFDITLLPRLIDLGYTHSVATAQAAPAVAGSRVGRCGQIELDFSRGTLMVPADAALDLGGIGKGFAADIVAEDLIMEGAAGALVNIGGDLIAFGHPGEQDSWYLGIENPLDPPNHLACVRVGSAGVATSGTTVRRWTTATGESVHHLIDPHTAAPSRAGLSTVTVLAGDAATAEVFATAAMMLDGPDAMAMLERNGLAGIGVGDDGAVHRSSTLAAFEV